MIWLGAGAAYLLIVIVFVAFGKSAKRGDRIIAGDEE